MVILNKVKTLPDAAGLYAQTGGEIHNLKRIKEVPQYGKMEMLGVRLYL